MPRIKENGLAISQPWHGFGIPFIEHVESMLRDDISQEHSAFLNIVRCIKRLAIFPSPAGMSPTKVLVSDIPAGDGKIANQSLFSDIPGGDGGDGRWGRENR